MDGYKNNLQTRVQDGDLSAPKSRSKLISTKRNLKQNNGARGNNSGGDGASDEEGTGGEDEPDSSDNLDTDEETDEEPEIIAPSGGHGKGKGLGTRPSIHVDIDEDVEDSIEDAPHHGTGLENDFLKVNHKKKRSLSDASLSSILQDDESNNKSDSNFPRKKILKALDSDANGRFKYDNNAVEDDDPREGGKIAEEINDAIESSDEDDEEVYKGVDFISDEEDASDVEDIETLVILDSEKDLDTSMGPEAMAINEFLACLAEPDTEQTMSGDTYTASPVEGGSFFNSYSENMTAPSAKEDATKRKFSDTSAKRVRFEDEVQFEEDSSSSDESSSDETLFPDLFLAQDQLPTEFRQLIEADIDEDFGKANSSDGEGSYWDFGDQNTLTDGGATDEELNDDTLSGESSGYESDSGDTTDEDLPPPRTINSPKSLLRRPSSTASETARSPMPFQRTPARTPPAGKFLPRRGTFSVNPEKAVAYMDKTGKRLVLVPASQGKRTRMFPDNTSSSITESSPRNSIAAINPDDSDFASEMSSQVITPGPMDLMLTGMLNFGQFDIGASAIGPPEAFIPMVDICPDGSWAVDNNGYDSDFSDQDDVDEALDVDAFMDLSQCADPYEEEDEEEEPANDGTTEQSCDEHQQKSQNSQTPGRSTSASMLEHFDRVPVTSFRSNQNLCRRISALPANPLDRKSATQPVKKGKSAETVISPLRRRGSAQERKKGRPASNNMAGFRRPRVGTFS